jgi:magnesium transporter
MSRDKPRKHPKRIRARHKGRVGAAPGVLTVDPEAVAATMTVLAFGPDHLEERTITSLAELDALERQADLEVLWLNLVGLGDLAVLSAIQERFGLHPLAMEDVVHVHQRAKVEAYDDHVFLVVRAHYAGDALATEQISFFLSQRTVVTFQERPGDHFEPVRARLRQSRGRIRQRGSDYLVYALLDAIVDGYFPVLEALGDRLEQLETVVFGSSRSRGDPSGAVNELRWSLLGVRRSLFPLRDVLRALQVDEAVQLDRDVQVFVRDCADHVMQALDHVETYQHMAEALMEGYLSLASHRMNEVMKVLTMIATIFIPLSFIAGIYGMNFDREASPWNMPELGTRFGYPALWLVFLSVVVGMLLFFRRKGWLSR